MPIVRTITSAGEFIDLWPESRRNDFSTYAKEKLFDYLDELSEDTGENIEFDPVAFCCDFVEYAGIDELLNDYGLDIPGDFDAMEEEEKLSIIEELLQNETQVICCESGCILIHQF